MTALVPIGNSYGVRIPKAIIEQAHLAGYPLKLKVVKGGLLISPISSPRAGWKKAIEKILQENDQKSGIDQEWVDASLNSGDEELEW